uniref:Uncharacterized protein n=1 Tax=Populus trichocarpa TaxID=3694 RepID=U5FXN2_POPTR
MPAAGSKGAPKNPGEIKDDTSSSREEKQFPVHKFIYSFTHLGLLTGFCGSDHCPFSPEPSAACPDSTDS